MSTEQLTAEAMALSLSERVNLAQALWASIETGLAEVPEDAAIGQALARDRELSAGALAGRPADDVIQTARRAIGCD
ncbi:MAG TPA: addiction module protein [Chthoniobacterales bacterium]|jgi:hypothetical protein